jgi:hypothetical protein
MARDELRDWFATNSSPSQARNAARFFVEACDVAGIRLLEVKDGGTPDTLVEPSPAAAVGQRRRDAGMAALYEKVPSYDRWQGTTEEYLQALESLARIAGST